MNYIVIRLYLILPRTRISANDFFLNSRGSGKNLWHLIGVGGGISGGGQIFENKPNVLGLFTRDIPFIILVYLLTTPNRLKYTGSKAKFSLQIPFSEIEIWEIYKQGSK